MGKGSHDTRITSVVGLRTNRHAMELRAQWKSGNSLLTSALLKLDEFFRIVISGVGSTWQLMEVIELPSIGREADSSELGRGMVHWVLQLMLKRMAIGNLLEQF